MKKNKQLIVDYLEVCIIKLLIFLLKVLFKQIIILYNNKKLNNLVQAGYNKKMRDFI